jgi:hypothetical protein
MPMPAPGRLGFVGRWGGFGCQFKMSCSCSFLFNVMIWSIEVLLSGSHPTRECYFESLWLWFIFCLLFWFTLVYFGLFWFILVYFGLFWLYFEYFGIINSAFLLISWLIGWGLHCLVRPCWCMAQLAAAILWYKIQNCTHIMKTSTYYYHIYHIYITYYIDSVD